MNEYLSELYAYALPMHKSFAHVLLMLGVIYSAIILFGVNTKNYVLRIRYFLPIYHMLLSFMILTGLVLSAVYDYALNFKILKMILVTIALIALSAVGFKKLKFYARLKQLPKFKKFALFQGVIAILLIIVAGV
ncbi:MAG: hypothetical protein LUC34_02625 [Campylobacter sp.]|nr:hypothetical protein [Campylobacter sp.]